MVGNTKVVINERRQKLWILLTKGLKSYDIAKELNVDHSTISKDIKYLSGQSQQFLNELARSTLPMMYQKSIDGITEVLKECWNIYQSTDESINWLQRISALKLAKECNEAQFKLLSDAPSIMYLRTLEEKLIQIENRQIR